MCSVNWIYIIVNWLILKIFILTKIDLKFPNKILVLNVCMHIESGRIEVSCYGFVGAVGSNVA